MATYQVTFIFQSGAQGWTESFYVSAETQVLLKEKVEALAVARQALISRQVRFIAWRASDVDILGDSMLVPLENAIQGPVATRDIPASALMMRVTAGLNYRRMLMLRGMPDDYVVYDATTNLPKPPVGAQGRMLIFGETLVLKGFQLKVISKAPADTQPTTVVAITLDAPTGRIAINCPNITEDVKELGIKIRGCTEGMKVLNRVWPRVQYTGPGSLLLPVQYTILLDPQPADYAKAKVYLRKNVYSGISDAQFLDYRTRQTGRAPFVPAGRRRVQR